MSSTEPRAWVTSERDRLLAEDQLEQLVGRRIERARYAEIAYADRPEPEWPGPSFDSLDYGLELDLDDGVTWSITWDHAGENEGILAYPGRHEHVEPGQGTIAWDVTDHWRDRGPYDIAAVTAVWDRPVTGHWWIPWRRGSDLCLWGLILTGGGGREAVITLGQRMDDGSFGHVHDKVAVFFSVAAARAAGVVLEP